MKTQEREQKPGRRQRSKYNNIGLFGNGSVIPASGLHGGGGEGQAEEPIDPSL